MNDLQAMRLYVRVVELGSFSKAAVDLGIGQPSATKLVAKLESQLGARLLFRSTRGVRPTELGTLFYEKCQLIGRHLEDAQSVAGLMQSQVRGALRVSTTMDFGRRVLAPLISRFLQNHPGVHIELLFSDDIVDLVAQGIDVAVRMGRLPDSSLGARYLGRNPWSVVASPGYMALHGRPTTPFDLPKHDALVISTVQNDSRWHFHSPLGEALSVQVKGPLRCNNKSALLTAACAGLGIAALPTYVVHGAVQRGDLVSLLEGWALPEQQIHAVFPSPRLVPAKVQGFADWLKDQMPDAWWTYPFETQAAGASRATSSSNEAVAWPDPSLPSNQPP